MTDPCDCCSPEAAPTPRIPGNRAGLPQIARRVGTHGAFKRAMHRAIDGYPNLRDLTARDDADPAMAAIDAWAATLDVLTFYQERIANEGYLRTARERRSLLELGAEVGYRLRPPTAAITDLALFVDETPGAPDSVLLEAGVRVQSQPGQDELPQIFETVEPITALRAWNRVPPRRAKVVVPGPGARTAVLADAPQDLKAGDLLLFVGDPKAAANTGREFCLRRVTEVVRDDKTVQTTVRWHGGLSTAIAGEALAIFVLRVKASLFGFNAPAPGLFPAEVRTALQTDTKWNNQPATGSAINLDAVYAGIAPGSWVVLRGGDAIALFQARAAQETVDTRFALSGKVTRIALDRAIPGTAFTPQNATVFTLSEPLRLAAAADPAEVSGSILELAAAVPVIEPGRRLIVEGALAHTAQTTVEPPTPVESEDEPDAPPPTPLPPGVPKPWNRIESQVGILIGDISFARMAGAAVSRPAGPFIFRAPGAPARATRVTAGAAGEAAGATRFPVAADGLQEAVDVPVPAPPGAPRLAEVVTVLHHETSADGPGRILLAGDLSRAYDRATFTVYGNAARATHGESHDDVIGSGDAAKPFQSFVLPQKPLTYLPGTGGRVADPALDLRVNGVTWESREVLFGADPAARAYEIVENEKGASAVRFGDGRTSGARLPSGVENVRARYRTGAGPLGRVKANQLSVLLTRPLGLAGATNPLAAEGGSAAEVEADARSHIPASILTLGRVVSVQDYADFCAAYPGIGKAAARLLWRGQQQIIHITVAGEDGADLASSPVLVGLLWEALQAVRDPHQLALLQGAAPLAVKLRLAVLTLSGFHLPDVGAAVTAALAAAFGFAARDFEAALTAAEVLAVAQRVAGVEAVALVDATPALDGGRIVARPARIDADGFHPADLLLVDAPDITIEAMPRAR